MFTNYVKQRFYYRGTVLWNSLKSTVTGTVTLLSFRTCYDLNSWFFVFVILLLFVVCVLFSYVFFFVECIKISLLYVWPGLNWKSVLLTGLPYNYNYNYTSAHFHHCQLYRPPVLSTVFMKPPSTWTRQPFSSSSFKGIFLKCDKAHIAHISIYLFIGWFAHHY